MKKLMKINYEKLVIFYLLFTRVQPHGNEGQVQPCGVKAKNSKGEIIIVEVQQDSECDFLGRILYGVSKSIIEHISLGEDYGKIKKIYSVNILNFNFGKGADYLYHGRTIFTGVNTHDTLQITTKQQNALEISPPWRCFSPNTSSSV